MTNEANEPERKTLPRLDIRSRINHSPHVVLLGAGASRACCPSGDANGQQLPLMADFAQLVGISDLLRAAGRDPEQNFEQTYSDIFSMGDTATITKLDRAVRNYFLALTLPDTPTLYDYLVLGLRSKDTIITFNWDPLLIQAYKRWRRLGRVLPELVFLHGNVDLGVDVTKKEYGFISDGQRLTPTPLLYPVAKKDYTSDPFVTDQWSRATSALAEAYFVSIIGYSAPQSDVEARSLLLNAWRKNSTRTLAQFSITDIRDSLEVKKSWSDFLEGVHGGSSTNVFEDYIMMHPRRTCEAFAFATLQQQPWHEDPFPRSASLDQLLTWVEPLIEEEKRGRLAGNPHH